MSIRALDEMRLSQPCPKCGAKPNVWCTNLRSGGFASAMHKSRGEDIAHIWVMGFHDGIAHNKRMNEQKKTKKNQNAGN